jgi:hypothetical protein
MATVTAKWLYNTPVNSPLTPGSTVVSIAGGALGAVLPGPVSVAPTASTADLLSVPPEADTDPMYVVSVEWFSNDKVPVSILKASSSPFSVSAPVPVLQGPGNVAVSVAP